MRFEFVAVAALCSTTCAQWGVTVQGFDDDDVEKVEAGLEAAVEAYPEAGDIVDRLDVFGFDLEDMPATCGLPEYRILEGCAVRPGSALARARIYLARDRVDLAATTFEEVEHLVFWGEPRACPPRDQQCLDDHSEVVMVSE